MIHLFYRLGLAGLLLSALLLTACDVPDWIYEAPAPSATATARVLPTVVSLATPIDALSVTQPAPTITLAAAALEPQAATAVAELLQRPAPAFEGTRAPAANNIGLPQPTSENAPRFSAWQGIIERLPAGAQEAFLFRRDDGERFAIDAPDGSVRGQFAAAAWSAVKVSLDGVVNVNGSLRVEALRELGLRSTQTRDLSAFAMASASSHLANDEGGSYQAWSLIDGLQSDPWCEGVDGPGAGEWLQLEFSAPLQIQRLEIYNGFDRDGYLFDSNNRVRELAVYLDGQQAAVWQLRDERGAQSLILQDLLPEGTTASMMRLVIRETTPGWQYDDTCVSELLVWGLPAE